MKKSAIVTIVLMILLIFFSLSSHLFSFTIKLGSLVPVGSPWDISFKHMAGEWKKISNGKVILKIYPGGIAGDESDMVRKMRIGQLHAAGITVVGLKHLFSGVTAVALPLMMNNEKELNYVLNKMKPYYEEKIEKKGFKILLWSVAGWTHFFSRKRVIKPDDLKKQKMFVWEGNADELKTWSELGFNPVPLPATEIMISLQSGMIDAFTTAPLMAASYQWFGIASHMCEMPLSPLLGGVVISKKTWNRIKPEWQKKFIKVVEKMGVDIRKDAVEKGKVAIKVMKKHGLKINQVPPNTVKEWKAIFDEGLKKIVGKSIHEESYNKVMQYLKEYRN